ncbi:MAG: ATP-binding cassette domain-containing protein [Thermoplasmata archaeon]
MAVTSIGAGAAGRAGLVLQIKNITFSYPHKTVFRDFCTTIGPGLVKLTGKTTLLKLIAGFLTPQKGDIDLKLKQIPKKVHTVPEVPAVFFIPEAIDDASQARISILTPDGYHYEDLSVKENLEYFYSMASSSMASATSTLQEKKRLTKNMNRSVPQGIAEFFGLGKFLDKQAGALSTGQKKRLDICISLLNMPHLLLLDEPLAHLDTKGAAAVNAMLALRRSLPYTLTIVTATSDRKAADISMNGSYVTGDSLSQIDNGSCPEFDSEVVL